MPDAPVATFATWGSELTVPGDRVIDALAISSVTVSATHRRRGIARALMEGELRTGIDHGFPVAMLTATEASIYQRYGFAPAAMAATWSIDPRRTEWCGAPTEGRVDIVSRDQARRIVERLHEQIRARRPGEAAATSAHWDSVLRTRPDATDPGDVRAVVHTGAAGVIDGVVVYRVTENEQEYADSSIDVDAMVTDSDDAYRALWRFLLEHDLIAQVRASELSVEEPLRWMLSDPRAARVEITDHHYVRVLDVVAALEARRYGAPGRFVLEITDPVGLIAGTYTLTVTADGVVDVAPGATAEGAVHVRMGATELAALYLGAHSADALHTAGRLRTDDPAALDRTFRSTTAPRLSFWY